MDILLSPGGGDRWEVGVGGTQRGRMGPFPLIQVTRWELENHSGITRSPHQPQCSLEVITGCSPGELRLSFGFSKYKNLFEACYMELSHPDFHNCRCIQTPLKPITSQSRKNFPHALDDRFDWISLGGRIDLKHSYTAIRYKIKMKCLLKMFSCTDQKRNCSAEMLGQWKSTIRSYYALKMSMLCMQWC